MIRIWCLAVNLYEHAKVNVGFRIAERQERREVSGEFLIAKIKHEFPAKD